MPLSFQLKNFKCEVNYTFGVVANMGKTNKLNLHDEKLATAVMKYPWRDLRKWIEKRMRG